MGAGKALLPVGWCAAGSLRPPFDTLQVRIVCFIIEGSEGVTISKLSASSCKREACYDIYLVYVAVSFRVSY